MTDPVIANSCRTEVSKDGHFVRLTFEPDAGGDMTLLVPAKQFPALAGVLQRQAEQMVPAKSTYAFSERNLILDGVRLSPVREGELTLTLSARVSDNGAERT